MRYTYYEEDLILPESGIFVFGSNLAGRHGKGAALVAKQRYGAIPGVGEGYWGLSYAIPTKDKNLKVLHISDIEDYVGEFKEVAQAHEKIKFWVTKIGCGLAGYKDADIAPLFIDSPTNCRFHIDWKEYLE